MNNAHAFHLAFGLPAPSVPSVPSAELLRTRKRLIAEEYAELKVEFDALFRELRKGKRVDQLIPIVQRLVKETADLQYVCEGTLVSLGVPMAYDYVHASTMSKLGDDGKPLLRKDGKVLKGPNYRPVDPEDMFPGVVDATT